MRDITYATFEWGRPTMNLGGNLQVLALNIMQLERLVRAPEYAFGTRNQEPYSEFNVGYC